MASAGVSSGTVPPISLTRLAVRRIQSVVEGQVSQTIRKKAVACLIDYLGAAHSGLSTPWGEALSKYATAQPGPPEAQVWGTNAKASAETAAFVNAALGHSTIRDDMHLDSCSHIGSIVLSAAIALAQRDHWSGENLIRAIVAGYEISALLGTAIRASGNFNPHFRPSGLVGAFGVAAAAIAGYGCSEEIAVSALGFALNAACGVNEWAWAGGLEIFTQMGTASRAGIQAFDIAKAGLFCSDTVLEGKDGLFEALGVGPDASATFKDWMGRSEIGKGIMDVHFKPVAGCNFAQTPLAAALRLRVDDCHSVQKIIVTATSQAIKYPGCNNAGHLENIQQSKMSIQYGVSAALVYARLDEEVFTKVNDPRIIDLMNKCDLRTSEQFDKDFQRGLQPAQVEVTLSDGRHLCQRLTDVPWLTLEEVESRFPFEVAKFMNKGKAVDIITSLKQLENTEQVADTFELFAAAAI
ncbi:hypothetical protein RBB50_003760 [Rhinocladiella similis]